MNLPHDLLQKFIEGYLDSDGTFCENNYKITTVSPFLAHGICQCVLKVFNTNYRLYFTERPKTKILEGRLINQRDTYQVVWNHLIDASKKKSFIAEDKLWFPIKEIEKLELEDDFYEVEFEEDKPVNMFYALCSD